jgi:hypothetical protein
VKERAGSALLALGALALFYLLFIGSPSRLAEDTTPRPTTVELRGNGYAAAKAWLESSDIRVVSWRERYGKLASANDSPRGNLLIVTVPTVDRFRTEELLPLDRWVRSGNTLLVLAALTDSPDWAGAGKEFASGDLTLLTNLEFRSAKEPDSADETAETAIEEAAAAAARDANADEEPTLGETLRDLAVNEWQTIEIVPRGVHPLSAGIKRLVAKSSTAAEAWALQVPLDDFAFTLAGPSTDPEGTLFVRSHGAGRIMVSTTATLFANRALGEGDNARLLSNIVAYAVSDSGAVLFDDLRQGLSASYEPERFWRDARLHWTLLVLVALWFVWVLGSTRLRAERATDTGPDEVALVKATGGMMARQLRPQAAALYLLTRFLRDACGARYSNGAPLDSWTQVAADPRVSRDDIDRLRAWHLTALGGRRVPLLQVHAALGRVRQQRAEFKHAKVSEQT